MSSFNARVSKMLTASFGPGTARKIEIELGLPIHFLDGADGMSEARNASLGNTAMVYLTEREQQIITAFRLATDAGKAFIAKAANGQRITAQPFAGSSQEGAWAS